MEKKVECYGTNIYYRTVGKGATVLLLHGFGEDSSVWQEQVEYLEAFCTVIVPDLPGSGKSGLLQKENITIGDYGVCISQLLENEGVEKCVVIGHSMGGYITLALADMFPRKLSGFGFVHSTAFADSEEKKANRLKGIQLMEEYGGYAFLKNSIPTLFSDSYRKEQPGKVGGLVEQAKQFSTEALVQYYRAMIDRPDRTAVLTKSAVPLLFIIGSVDTAAPLQDLLQQVHLPRTSFIHVLQGVGHMGMWEKPREVNSFLLQFIQYCFELE